jgi:hypothetical protein
VVHRRMCISFSHGTDSVLNDGIGVREENGGEMRVSEGWRRDGGSSASHINHSSSHPSIPP